MQKNTIAGFSRFSKSEKVNWAAQHFFNDPEEVVRDWAGFCHPDEATQKILDGLSENTLSNYHLPYGIAPNFVINGKAYAVPMVIEESSVVAAASSAAKFWMDRGGFHAEVLDTKKLGQVHFSWTGDVRKLYQVFEDLRAQMLEEASPLTANMEKRGGGIIDIRLIDMTHLETA
ncbi:MAG: hydroxymethylglutaryl-CoA reductase, partial [Saprospiraceae bacterium]|nr:hydroxymethylglutaryl-CoA reductase [Saprospiraceae bacterium]